MLRNKVSASVIGVSAAVIGIIGGTAFMASAQTTPAATGTPVAVTSSTASGAAASSARSTAQAHGHAPVGGDGIVSSVSGSTIVMAEEADEGGASYTVDASGATVTNNGAAATVADIKAGDKIFVQGTVSGTTVAASSVSLGRPERGGNDANDTDGGAASEASENASTSSASDQ